METSSCFPCHTGLFENKLQIKLKNFRKSYLNKNGKAEIWDNFSR